MAYTEKTTSELMDSLEEFSKNLPEDQREALNDLLTAALKAVQENPSSGKDILSAGRTDELVALAAKQHEKVIAGSTAITVTTVTTSLQSSRWLC